MQKNSLGARMVVWISKWRKPFLADFMAVGACFCLARMLTIVGGMSGITVMGHGPDVHPKPGNMVSVPVTPASKFMVMGKG